MSLDCKWVGKNLEALFCDGLNAEETKRAQGHIQTCTACRADVQALNAIDPLIKNYFQHELEIARRPPVLAKARVFGLSSAAVALVAILLVVALRAPQAPSVIPAAPSEPQIGPAVSIESPASIKNAPTGEIERAKPSPAPSAPADRKAIEPAPLAANAPEFFVTDPAGYTRTLDDYRGHVVVIGVWSMGQSESTANLDRLYKAFGSNPKFRFLGVSNQRAAKPANTTFPVAVNQGSKLFGAQSGEFVVLDETGKIEMRGSLVKDFESLRKALQGK